MVRIARQTSKNCFNEDMVAGVILSPSRHQSSHSDESTTTGTASNFSLENGASFPVYNSTLERPSRPSCLKKEVPATDSNGDKRRRRLRRNVLFDTISMRQYQVILDNNPLASFEPSLTLDWNHFSEVEIDIDDYESVRDPRRSMQDLKIDHTQRKHILSLSGHRKKDMGEATKIDVSVKNKGYRAHYFSKLKRSFLEHKIARPRIRT